MPIGGGENRARRGSYITWDRAKASRLFDAIKQDQPIPPDVIEKK